MPSNGDPAVVHRFQKTGLRFGRSTVNLIGKQNVAHYGSFTEFKITGFAVEDVISRYVGGGHVGSELHSAERQTGAFRKSARKRRLTYAGDVFDYYMSSCKQGAEEQDGFAPFT